MVEIKLLKEKLEGFWFEFRHTKIGIVGLVILAVLIVMAILPWFICPVDTYEKWYLNSRWDLNPPLAPPSWINLFSEKKYTPWTKLEPIERIPYYLYVAEMYAEQQGLNLSQIPEEYIEQLKQSLPPGMIYIFQYDYRWDIPTKNIVVIVHGVNESVNIRIDIERPHEPCVDPSDELLENTISGTYNPSHGEVRVFFMGKQGASREGQQLLEKLKMKLISKYDNVSLERVTIASTDPLLVLFSSAGPGMSVGATPPLKGVYTFTVYLIGNVTNETSVEIVISGSCYGPLGTDDRGRDIFVGILWGTHLALLMGVAYAAAVTGIGLVYGATSGYLGGRVDAVMQRIAEVMYSIPGFAFVILLVYMFRELYGSVNIWIIILVYIIFGWPYMSMVIRSMAMQIKAQPYIEAARAIGASSTRILFLHVVPQLIPYTFASMVLTIPNAIMIEAALSVLGLGNPWIPTWGRILASAIDSGQITAWWWFVPPGLMIAVTGIAFIFIGNALETILNPRLRRR